VDEKIAEAIETMGRIGFTDEDGWLTALLGAHSGDINRALDAIHSYHKNMGGNDNQGGNQDGNQGDQGGNEGCNKGGN
jgi:hypothetical protein